MPLRIRLCIAFCALSIFGCGPQFTDPTAEKLMPRSSDAVLSYEYPAGKTALGSGSKTRVHSFLRDLDLTDNDIIVVSVPKMTSRRGTAARQREMLALLSSYPARLRLMDDRTGPVSNNGLIRVSRVVAINTTCDPASGVIGCSNASNLAKMIAVPADSVLPVRGRRHVKTMEKPATPLIHAGALP